jgi:cleavage stimulation factor subunit 2
MQPTIDLAALQALPPDQRNLITQVMSLTDDQIAAMPPDQRNQVQSVRQMVFSSLMKPAPAPGPMYGR